MVGSATILVESRDTKLSHAKGIFFLNVYLGAAAPTHCVASRDRELNRRMGLFSETFITWLVPPQFWWKAMTPNSCTRRAPSSAMLLDLGAAAPTCCVASRDREFNWSTNPSLASRDRELNWSTIFSLDITFFITIATMVAV
jgi:hypothetical protein